MNKKTIFAIAAVLVAALLVLFVRENNAWKEKQMFAMDTFCFVQIKGNDKVLDKAEAYIKQQDQKFNAYSEQSAVYALNATGKTTDPELAALTQKLMDLSQKTEGAYDFTLKSVSDQWGFQSENPKVPKTIDLSATGPDKVQLTENNVQLNGAQVDFGGVAKGYVTDGLVHLFKQENVKNALIDLGGNIYAVGTHKIGIKAPVPDSQEVVCSVTITDCAMITSGVYQRFFTDEKGNKWHHILDPKTGYPANSGLLSVTVIGKDATTCDVLSTAFLVLGKDKTLELYKDFDVQVVLITQDTLYYSAGLADKIDTENTKYNTEKVS